MINRGNAHNLATSANDEAFAHECADFFEDVGKALRLPPSIGQIYGLLYGTSCPLCFTDIVERLRISKGSASQGLQLLRSLGAVHVAENSSNRREYFEPELSLRRLMGEVLRERITPIAVTGRDRMTQLRQFATQSKGNKDFCSARVEQLEIWRRRLKTALPFIISFLGPKQLK